MDSEGTMEIQLPYSMRYGYTGARERKLIFLFYSSYLFIYLLFNQMCQLVQNITKPRNGCNRWKVYFKAIAKLDQSLTISEMSFFCWLPDEPLAFFEAKGWALPQSTPESITCRLHCVLAGHWWVRHLLVHELNQAGSEALELNQRLWQHLYLLLQNSWKTGFHFTWYEKSISKEGLQSFKCSMTKIVRGEPQTEFWESLHFDNLKSTQVSEIYILLELCLKYFFTWHENIKYSMSM